MNTTPRGICQSVKRKGTGEVKSAKCMGASVAANPYLRGGIEFGIPSIGPEYLLVLNWKLSAEPVTWDPKVIQAWVFLWAFIVRSFDESKAEDRRSAAS